MKKSIILVAAMLFAGAATSYAQTKPSTPSASSQPENKSQNKSPNNTTSGQSQATSTPTKTGSSDKTDGTAQQARKTKEGDGSNRPGGESHKNANDVGRYSDKEDAKSMTNSKEAIAQRRKNLTESDTTVKKGSGSAPKNTKNHTGKTGNYENQEIKHNQKTPTRP